MAKLPVRLVRNVSWNLVDQALSALSNTVLSIIVARSVSAADFGSFSIAFVVFGVFIALTKSLVGQPLQIRFAGAAPGRQRRAISHALGSAALVGVVGAVVVAVVSRFVSPSVGWALLALAVVLPALLIQDSCRMAMFAIGTPRSAAAIDAVWTLVQLAGLGVLVLVGVDEVPWLIIAWGVGAAASAVLGLVLLRVVPALRRGWGWFQTNWDLTRYLFPEYFLGLGAMQLAILLVGVIASAESVGSLRAAQVLLGPLGIIGAGVFQFAVPEIARRASLSSATMARFAAAVSGGLGLVTVVYVIVLLVLPARWGITLFGASWSGAAAVLLAMGLSAVASSLANGPAGILYGIGSARLTFRINLAKGPILLVAVLVGTSLAGAVGAAWGLALTEAAVLPAWVLTMRYALRRRHAETEPAPVPTPSIV